MKRYLVYRDIRKRALIFGLPVWLFALQMLGGFGSLLVVIFSFSLLVVLGAALLNILLYIVLMELTRQPHLLHVTEVFPKIISNKKTTPFRYED